MRLIDVDEWAQGHHGLITVAASGASRDAWRRALRSGSLDQVHPGVARIPGTARTPFQRIAAAVLAAGPDTIASHRSAALLWDLPIPDPTVVDVIMATRGRRTTLPGIVAHRPTDRLRLVPQRRRNIACTNILRTLCDLGAVDSQSVSPAVGHALSAGLVDLNALETTVLDHSAQGRAGIVALRDAVDEWSIDAKPADSILETAFRNLADRYRLPPLEFHPVIEGWEVDFRVIGTRVLLECDGWTTHGLDRRQFERDRDRRNDLTAAGWIIVHFTYRSVTRRPAETAERIRRSVARWTAGP